MSLQHVKPAWLTIIYWTTDGCLHITCLQNYSLQAGFTSCMPKPNSSQDGLSIKFKWNFSYRLQRMHLWEHHQFCSKWIFTESCEGLVIWKVFFNSDEHIFQLLLNCLSHPQKKKLTELATLIKWHWFQRCERNCTSVL